VDDKLARLDGKVDMLSAKDGEHTVRLVALEVRVAQLEAAKERLEGHVEDIGGFLRSEGYRKRDAPKDNL
jgi:hypothetical protein